MSDVIEVSILCLAYNHEKYIRNALDGFVSQKTNFHYEILIHDDASTDNTVSIIREYEEKYPDIIKPIYETENQYSKHDGSLARIQYGRVRGKYIAVCEGDDYWTDPEKLQKQYDLLEQHPEVDICATSCLKENNGEIIGKIAPSDEVKIFPVKDVILGGGDFVGTATLMYRTKIRKDPLPFFKVLSIDYTVQILGSLRGGMLFLPDQTTVYRVEATGSWSERSKADFSIKEQMYESLERVLLQLDEDTNHNYHESINQRLLMERFSIEYGRNNYKGLIDKKYNAIFEKLPVMSRIIIKIGTVFPNISNYIRKIKNGI